MEYQVPQFIEIEDKIVGPLTLKQFIYLAGGTGLCVVLFIYLPIYLALLLGAPVAALALALAFYKVNGKPFIEVLEAGFGYYVGSKLFLWRHEASRNPAPPQAPSPVSTKHGDARISRSKLSELAWSLDVSAGGGSASGGQKPGEVGELES
ncbi:MAG: PrgI family protein [bacterium]|nr:PrgI family protein [bacterium]